MQLFFDNFNLSITVIGNLKLFIYEFGFPSTASKRSDMYLMKDTRTDKKKEKSSSSSSKKKKTKKSKKHSNVVNYDNNRITSESEGEGNCD